MNRGFVNSLRKFTSLLLATMLFSCCFESLMPLTYAENEAEYSEAEYSEAEANSEVYDTYDAQPHSQEVPGDEGGYSADYGGESYSDTASDGLNYEDMVIEEADDASYAYAEDTASENDAEYSAPEEAESGYEIDSEGEAYSLNAADVQLYSTSYTLTQDDIDAYNALDPSDPNNNRYSIDNEEDWLRAEALSKSVGNFEGIIVEVHTNDNEQDPYHYYLDSEINGMKFTGLGSAAMPFAGTLMTSMNNVSVYCDCPLIAYMSSKASMEQFVLYISGGNAGIAGSLIFEGDADQTMLLKGITVYGYLEDTAADGVGGLFGTVTNTTSYKFTIDADSVVSGSWGGITMNFEEHDGKAAVYGTNVGTFIGKMVGNVTFNINNDFHIDVPSLYGTQSTGSIVGKMEYSPGILSASMEQSQLSQMLGYSSDISTYPTIHFNEWSAFSVKNIQGTGYNGGIVGYTDHANIYNDTSNDVLEINDSYISGGKAAGGFIGRAEYTTIDGNGMGEIKVMNSTFECTIATVQDGISEGYVGGFIGIYGDGNSLFNGIAITVSGDTFTTINDSGTSVTRYLGGLIGKYESADNIVITPESKSVTISDVDFKIYAANVHCGGFVSYVPADAGSLDIDTSLYLSNIRAYVPSDAPSPYISYSCGTNGVGGIASAIESDNLHVTNITITALTVTLGRYVGAIAGRITGENTLLENITVADMSLCDYIMNDDGTYLSHRSNSNYRENYGSGALVGLQKRGAVIRNITVTGFNFSPYIKYGQSNDPKYFWQQGAGGLIGILGDCDSQYTITDIYDISISGEYNIRYYTSGRNGYSAGLIGYVYPKTAVCLDKVIDLSGITLWKSSYPQYSGKYIGFQREALIYMQPTCTAIYNEDSMGNFDEVGIYGGIYRNESFWDDAMSISDASVSVEGEQLIIERDSTKESGIKINGSVQTYDGGWGLSTMGDYMRFSIVNNTIGYYGMECFSGAAEYTDISGGIFTAMNDIDLSRRYMGVLTLNRNDNTSYNDSNFNYSKYHFHGTFKGFEPGGNTKITLPGVKIYSQNNVGGLFSVAVSAVFKDLWITGTLETACYSYQNYYNYIGALSSYYYNKADVENVIFKELTINSYYNNGSYRYEGILFGRWYYYMSNGSNYVSGTDYNSDGVKEGNCSYVWESSIKNITTDGVTVNISGTSGSVYMGTIASELRYTGSTCTHTVNFDNVNLKNIEINNATSSGYITGLIANTYGTHSRRIILNLNDVKIDGMNINTAATGNMGGFWGYDWVYTDVNLKFTNNTDKVIVDNSKINVTYTGTGTRVGGMLYEYDRSTLDMSQGLVIQNTEIYMPKSTAVQSSFFVSQAAKSFVIFNDYRLIKTKVTTNASQFDELVGCNKNNGDNQQQYNMGIVTISDSVNPFSLKKEDFHVYEYQSDYTDCPNMAKPYYNPYTRYYYNLDKVRDEAAKNPIKIGQITFNGTSRNVLNIETPEQLMIWHIIHTVYCYSSSYDTNQCYYLWKYFYDCIEIDNKDNVTTNTLRGYSIRINGIIDMTGLSFYPTAMDLNTNAAYATFVVGADFDNANAGSGANGIVFNYDDINTCTNRALANGEDVIPLKSGCTTGNYYDASQHSLMQSGLFGYNSSITEINDISFGGSVGATRYNASAYYSGAAFCGLTYNTTSGAEVYFKNIDINGLYVINPKEDYDTGKDEGSLENWQGYYGLLMGGWENSYMKFHFDTIETTFDSENGTGYSDFVKKYPNKKAASALIGHVGTSSITSLKIFDFANMSIADAEETNVLTANGTNLTNIHATPEDQVLAYASYIYSYQYISAEKGYYNFDDVCYFYGNGQFTPASGDKYYITLGKELGNDEGTTKTEYYNTASLVGTASYDSTKAAENTDYINFTESAANNYWLDFSNLNYKPYIANYEEKDINVNYKSGDLDQGCGTYEDPYIIKNAKQLYSLYCYLSPGGIRIIGYNSYGNDSSSLSSKNRYPQYNSSYKTMLNEWVVNAVGTDDSFCDGTHEPLTYNYEEHPVTGFDDKLNEKNCLSDHGADGTDSRVSVNLLRNAYYKITADIDMSDYSDFYGLCHYDLAFGTAYKSNEYFPFTGVIIGEKPDGSAPVITMPKFKKFSGSVANLCDYTRSYGFVAAAKGCVLKNLTVRYTEDSYARIQVTSNVDNYSFGGAIGTIWGGDNIIDNVRVEGAMMVNSTYVYSTTKDKVYRGGLVGALYGGSLKLRNLSTDDFADFDFRFTSNTGNVKVTPVPDKSYTGELAACGACYDYTNGIVGRVINAYVICESVDEPRSATDADGVEQKKLKLEDDDGSPVAVLDFSEYDATDPQKLHAQSCVDIINEAYLKDSGRIKITREGYNFDTEIANNKQLFIYSLAMNSGAFYTAAGTRADYYYVSYPAYIYYTRNNLTHVYHCSATASDDVDEGYHVYDIYSRCRKAQYDAVGNCTETDEDYKYAKNYDNLMTEEYFETDASTFDANSYRNYIGYNYIVANYFDFVMDGKDDEFWIMRRSGVYNNDTNYYYSMHNLYNLYKSGHEYSSYGNCQGRTSTHLLANTTYDMTVFGRAFNGIGVSWDWAYAQYNACLQNGDFDGRGATVKLGMNSVCGSPYAGLFTRLNPGFSNTYSTGYSYEGYPLIEIKNINLTGYVYNQYNDYRGNGNHAGMLVGDCNAIRLKLSNITVDNAKVGAYQSMGGIGGFMESSTQYLIDNCTVKNSYFTNRALGNTYNNSTTYVGGFFGNFQTNSATLQNRDYITNCSAEGLTFDVDYNTPYVGGFSGLMNTYYTYMYDFTAKDLTLNASNTNTQFGAVAGYHSAGNAYSKFKNTYISDIKINTPNALKDTYIGGAFGRAYSSPDYIYMENTHVNGMSISSGNVQKPKNQVYFQSNSLSDTNTNYRDGAQIGGIVGYSSNMQLHMDGVYVENIRVNESKITESNITQNADGLVTASTVNATQRIAYFGGIVGQCYCSSYESNIRITSLKEGDEAVTATPAPKPTARPMYRSEGVCYEVPEEPSNLNKGERNYIKNNDFIAQRVGGVVGYVNNINSYGFNTQSKTAWLINDLDITDNKLVANYNYRNNTYVDQTNGYSDDYYLEMAGGVFGYINKFNSSDLYSSGVLVEHNVIGSTQNASGKTYLGGVCGASDAAYSASESYSGYSHYYYNLTLKNNYIGPLDLIKNEEDYYWLYADNANVRQDKTYRFIHKLSDTYNNIRTMSIDELGALTRLYVDGKMVSSDSWDYSVSEPGTGEWYAQDNLYRYTAHVGLFDGASYYQETSSYRKRLNVFYIEPNIVYENGYTDSDGNYVASAITARRPAVDVGSTAALGADDDLYSYRDYTHIIYDDANAPTKYGEWDAALADNVVAQALADAEGIIYDPDNNNYLFAQLRNIYGDYKNETSDGYIDTAEYDETTHIYRLEDNYGQVENGYTMDEVYDYIYYGYDRDTDGAILNPEAGPHFLSPYTDKDDKIIPMLVYKSQYGTPDVLVNTIINILTNNAGAYNANVGYFNENTVPILNVESWKMKLENGVATAVYNEDGTHKQGGFSVSYEDVLPSPAPASTARPCPKVRKFSLQHTSYDTMKDDKNGTFTVLHITYGYNITGLSFAGNTITTQETMVLDIPVYVSKLLEVQINMVTLADAQLSQSNLAANGKNSGTVVLKSTNTIMAEYVYDYPRTMYDDVSLKKKLTFETSPGSMYLYKNTKITLIDVTDHSKEYYYYIDKTVPNPQIPFEYFVDAYGNNYKTRNVANLDDYPILGTESSPFTDLRGQTWGGTEEELGDKFINDFGVGVERFIIIIDKSATEIDASDQSGYTIHSVHVRVDDENTSTKLMERIRYDGRDYLNTPQNTPTEEYPYPDWYAAEVNGYTAYNYVNIREIDDVKIDITSGSVDTFGTVDAENLGIGPGKGIKATVDFQLSASSNYWNEIAKTATEQYLDFVISVQRDNRDITLPVGTKYSFDGVTWYTIGAGGDYEYGKKQIYYYADRASIDDSYKLVINKLGKNTAGTLNVYFDFRDCGDNSFSDGNYYIKVDAYKTTKREFPISGDYQDSWLSDVYSVYNSNNIGFALQENDLLYRGINRYLPKVSDNGVIDFKAQLDFRKYVDEESGKIKDVVANQYYTLGIEVMKKNSDGTYSKDANIEDRFKFYCDHANLEGGVLTYDGVIDDSDPLMWGYNDSIGDYMGGVTYKFTEDQLNGGSSISGVMELSLRLVYDTNNLSAKDFSNYKFTVYLYLSDETVSGRTLTDGTSETLTKTEIKTIEDATASPLSDFLIFTLARLKTD